VVSLLPREDRVHFLQRVAREIPELRVHSLFLRRGTYFGREVALPGEINPVEFCDGARSESAPNRGVPVWTDWAIGGRVIGHLRQHDVRTVIINGYRSVAMLRVVRWCRRAGVSVLLRSDSNIECERIRRPSRLFRLCKRAVVTPVVRACDGVMPMGELGVRYFEQYGARRERCFYSPSVPAYARFSEVPPEAVGAFRRRYGLDPGRRHILACGRLIRLKRFDVLIDAFAEFARGHDEWDLLIAGSGPLGPTLRARVPSHLADRVRWLGALPWDEMPLAYACADVFVLTSEIEAWGVVVIEAMLAGNATVSTPIAQAADEIIEDGVSGRLIEPGSVGSLAAALDEVSDPAALDRYGRGAREAVHGWIGRRDPVMWLRRALIHFGVIGASASEPIARAGPARADAG
jgi:glycosyltransferase involved in cell wall biosynthesis